MAVEKKVEESKSELSFVEKLQDIQSTLKAPKGQYNSFGKYAYRNQEDILEAVKPLLGKHKLVMNISDEMIEVGGRIYVEATVRVTDGKDSTSSTAYAREEESKKGMDSAQLTGSTSSYARKYALNGMFLIDDTKDADTTNTHGKELATKTSTPQATTAPIDKTPVLDMAKLKTALDSNKEGTLSQLSQFKYLTQEQVTNLKLLATELVGIEIR